MKRNILALTVLLALCAVVAVAQSSTGQDQSQSPSSQQPSSPSGSSASQSGSMSQSGGSDQSVQQIQSALQQKPELSGVTASASGDKIELSGTVSKKEDKAKAKSIAESNAGGKKVVDKIKVSGSSGSSAAPSSDSTQNPPKS